MATLALFPVLQHVCFVSASDYKSSARCPWWKTPAEDQQEPGALRHHVERLQPGLGGGRRGPSLRVSAGGRWCEAPLRWSRSPSSPQSGSPPLFSRRPLGMWMITVAEKTNGYGLRKPILQWPAAGNWDWEGAGLVWRSMLDFLSFFFLTNVSSGVTFIIEYAPWKTIF